MARPVLANLGFVLQIAGMFMFLPIVVGFYLNETQPLIAYFMTAIAFFGAGFLFNAFSKRENMDFKSSATLLFSVFLLLGLIGSIPYVYLDVFPGPAAERFTNSLLESLSGYTTGGLSLITDIESLPDSLVFYRGLTQWVGGIGIIFILLAFFYPGGETLNGIARMLGLNKMVEGIRLVLGHVLVMYSVYVAAFVAILYLLGFTNLIQNSALMMSSLATGGFSPVNDFTIFSGNLVILFFVVLAMFLGSLNFFVHDKLVRARIRGVFKTELVAYIFIILVGIGLFSLVSGLSTKDSVFNVLAASTTSGFSTVNIAELNDAAKMILVFLMFVGGMTFSTAGGIKVFRLVMFIKAVPWVLHKILHPSRRQLLYEGEEVGESEASAFMLVPGITLMLILISIFVFTLHGFGISDGLFETVSSFSLTGFSTGEITASTPLTLKVWVMLLLLIGRVEVLVFLIVMMSRRMLHLHDVEK